MSELHQIFKISCKVCGPESEETVQIWLEGLRALYTFECKHRFPSSKYLMCNAHLHLTIGIRAPVQPNLDPATDITPQSATVSWSMPTFSCLPEEYRVEYGLRQSSLDQRSDTLLSDGDPSVINATFSVELTGLMPDTVYFYRVVAMNIIGDTASGMMQFETPEPGSCTATL